MKMFTILMNNNSKQLTVTNSICLHQHENLVDKICFIVPYQYSSEIDLRGFSTTLYWCDPTGVAHVDILVKEEETYKDDYQRYFLPVTSPLNRYAGDIEAKLVFTQMDYETKTRYKLESCTVIIPIETIKDFYAVIPDESFNAIDDRIDELKSLVDQINTSAEIYDKTKADNIVINEDGNVQLQAKGEFIGDSVGVAVVEVPDDFDDMKDGILDITGMFSDDPDPDPEPGPTPSNVYATNHTLNDKGQIILTNDGKQIGDAINVANVNVSDDFDGTPDGLLDITGMFSNVDL